MLCQYTELTKCVHTITAGSRFQKEVAEVHHLYSLVSFTQRKFTGKLLQIYTYQGSVKQANGYKSYMNKKAKITKASGFNSKRRFRYFNWLVEKLTDVQKYPYRLKKV